MTALVRHWNAVQTALAHEKRRSATLIRGGEETDFLPAALEIIERPVSPTARITGWVLLALLVATILWLVFGKVDIVASAPGKLVPAASLQLVQPAAPGVVRAIHVAEGDRVKAGELLVELDPTTSDADVAQATKALETAELDTARLRAVLSALEGRGLAFQPPAGASPDAVGTQLALARAQLLDIQSGASTRRADVAAAAATRAEAQIQAAKLTETLPLLDEQIAANEKLLEKGYVSKLRVIEMRRQRLASARDRDAALATARRADAQIAAASGGGAQSAAEARSRILGDLAKAEADVRLRREELTKATQQSRYQRLVSPVDGVVAQLAVRTIGGVVEPAKPVLTIVPSGGPLLAEVKLPNKDVGFVAPGQKVAVKLEAFPFTRYGSIPGRVAHVGSDAIEDEKLGLVYVARVALDRATIERDGDRVALAPGMAATADIRTGSRSIGSYLLSPIDAARQQAARER